ncbi:MAG: RNA polymerase factor sigma-54 [Candidatus Stahlbacteria bacterium]|nr:RNA polymerase factor sigma-54 [Candidatus Stahlbacteria bacterium]
MKLEQKLDLRLAPILLQRLNLLMLPQIELRQLIRQELELNPFLEKEDGEDDELPLPEEIDDWDRYPQSMYEKPEEERDTPLIALKPTLKEHLLSQLRVTVKDEKLIAIGEYIIYELNEDGYLQMTIEEISTALNENKELVESVLMQVQQFDPAGVGAKNLQECLELQLNSIESNPRVVKIAIRIIRDFFDDFIAKDYEKIKNRLQITDIEFVSAIKCIKLCRAKPGKIWEGEPKYILPEIVVEYEGDKLVVSLTNDWIPKIRLSASYKELLRDAGTLTAEEKSYLRKKLNDAKLLLEGIEKRRETITAIAEHIVENEADFLTNKDRSLNLLTLEEVAQVIDRNPSTVSRAIKDKWLQTPRGAFKMKMFFSGGKLKEYTDIKQRIKELVNNEDKSAPISDIKIAELMEKEGIKVARTTVIKYRTQLDIPTAKERRV